MTLYAEIDDAAKEMYKDGYTGDLVLHCGPWTLVRIKGGLPSEVWKHCEGVQYELMSTLGQRIILVFDQSVPRDEWIMRGKRNMIDDVDVRARKSL